jgi:uncharacterized protein YPO0396
MHVEHLFDMRPERPGFRLQRLEVFNWGTFDSSGGQIYRFEPAGRTALLVGDNGSGKSTLVDAILTLLVPNHIRNYNVAAGAKKTERSERTYIRGAYGRTSDASQSTEIKYLRPKGDNLTALAAVFRDEQVDRAFTICQVLHLKSDGSPDHVFAIADETRELKSDLAGIESSDEIRERLQCLGYQTTKSFTDYNGWIARRTGMRSKAMDMFNQTVAVKDIRSLNEFIRLHMLEAADWRDKLQRLLTHFNDLNLAHQELVRAQHAERLLIPVERLGKNYQEQSEGLATEDRRLQASDLFFNTEIVRLCEPEVERRKLELSAVISDRDRFWRELKVLSETVRSIRNEIDLAGGQRLRDLPALIQAEAAVLNSKQEARQKYLELIRRCELDGAPANAEQFADFRDRLEAYRKSMETSLGEATKVHEKAIVQRALLSNRLDVDREELTVLSERQSKLPPHFATLRGRLCRDLQLEELAVPFAAELISVAPEERRWEASIEMVLRSFSLSLLVPENLYHRVRSYVERTKLLDHHGEGRRLVYLRIGKSVADIAPGDRLDPRSMIRKLRFRTGLDLVPWVRNEIQRKFDFRCCETIEEFNEVDRLGMTENRHVKFGHDRHEKDDRPHVVEPRNFVLGWDNREKKRLIAEKVREAEAELLRLDATCALHAAKLEEHRRRRDAATAALSIIGFDSIDCGRHEKAIEALNREKSELESSNQTVKTLKRRLETALKAEESLTKDRDAAVRREQSLGEQIDRETKLIEQARQAIVHAKSANLFVAKAAEFGGISESLGEPPLTVENLFVRRAAWTDSTRLSISRRRDDLQPLAERLLEAMTAYLRDFKEERTDLIASVHAIDSFFELLRLIRHEDLPRYERKFKDRLNDKVSQEIALLHTALRQECKQLEGKIEQLNAALAELEYNPRTFMRLEPREVDDLEIAGFRRSLRECLDESLETSDAANEARFLRIQKLVDRLSDKDNTRWRDKVIDVRQWYDFAAREIEKDGGKSRSYYEDSTGQSGGEKAKLAFTILVAAIAYQYDLDPSGRTPARFHFVVVDEMFSRVDDKNAVYALKLFRQFGLQLLIVAPLDAKARVTEPFVDHYLQAVKDNATNRSQLYSMTAREYEEVAKSFAGREKSGKTRAPK